jgi:hypothetical protein
MEYKVLFSLSCSVPWRIRSIVYDGIEINSNTSNMYIKQYAYRVIRVILVFLIFRKCSRHSKKITANISNNVGKSLTVTIFTNNKTVIHKNVRKENKTKLPRRYSFVIEQKCDIIERKVHHILQKDILTFMMIRNILTLTHHLSYLILWVF